MALASDELGSLTRAFSGLGVDEKALISILGKWNSEQRQGFRKDNRLDFFIEDEHSRQFQRWDDRHILQLRHEFLRLKDSIVLWTMHPWERDARLLKESLYNKGPGGPQYNVLIEIACTRSSEELLGARKAYHSLFNHSIEEDVAFHVHGPQRKLLVALLSSYRYEGAKVNEEIAKVEAKALSDAAAIILIREGGHGGGDGLSLIENEEVVRILSTRSKLHLNAVYKEIILITTAANYYLLELDDDQDVDGESRLVKQTLQCLCAPQTYFSQVLDRSLRHDADEVSKEAVTRVIVTRAEQIKEEYGVNINLAKRIEDVANGNYRDFLLTLIN